MMIKKNIPITGIFLAILFFGLSPQTWAQTKYQNYFNKRKHLSIDFPTTWDVKPDYKKTLVMAMSPKEGEDDPFQENVNIATERIPSGMKVDKYYAANLKTMQKYLKDFKILKKSFISISIWPAIKMIATHHTGDLPSKVIAYFMTVGSNGYVISGTALPETFDKYKDEFVRIGESFKLHSRKNTKTKLIKSSKTQKKTETEAKTEIKTKTVTPPKK